MPRYTIQVPDGRHVTVEANSQDDAMTGVQGWYEANPKPAPPPKPPGPVESFVGGLGKSVQEYGHDFMEANRQSGKELDTALHGFVTPPKSTHMRDLSQSHFLEAGPVVSAALNRIGAPMAAPFTTAFGRPAETLTHGAVKKEDVGNLASVAIPGAGELAGERMLAAEAARLARVKGITEAQAASEIKAARAPSPVPKLPATGKPRVPGQAEHQARAQRLVDEGVELTPKQRTGGLAKEREDRAATGSPYKGAGIQQARARSEESFLRATYNRALAPIGERFNTAVRVGHDGVKEVHSRLDAAYDRVLANAIARVDPTFKSDMLALTKKVSRLPPDERNEFAAIIKDEVTQRFSAKRGTPAGTMTGSDFKLAESELKRIGKTYKGSASGRERELGDALIEAAEHLRDSVERNSSKPVIAKLRAVDQGWAVLARMEQATAKAGRNDGLFTPGQLLDAVKAPHGMPGRTRTRAFAHGKAPLQQFAQDAHAVMGSKVADPGTAAQMKTGVVGRTISGAAGATLGELFGHNPITTALGGLVGGAVGGPMDDFIARMTNEFTGSRLRGKMSPTVRQAIQSPRLGPTVAGAGLVSEAQPRKHKPKPKHHREVAQ